MPKIKVATPSSEQIKNFPREFGILAQIGATNGGIDEEVFTKSVKELGAGGGASIPSGEISFEEAAAALKKSVEEPKAEASANAVGWAAHSKDGPLAPLAFTRREVGKEDVRIQISHCGICHSDLHTVREEWGPITFPLIPGHEIVGIVTEVGPGVTDFKVGDRAGVGCMVGNTCRSCELCKRNEEQYCDQKIFTYNTKDVDGTITQGGYSTHIVVDKAFVLHMPANLPLDASAPLLCAGITTYSPLKFYGLDKPGTKLGVVGLGGLGHMAVKLGKAMGCEVTVISTSIKKKQEAIERLGADHFLVSKDEEAIKAAAKSFDGIIDTVSAQHDLGTYLPLLKVDGKIVIVGVPETPFQIHSSQLAFSRNSIGGSLIGSVKETQEMLDFCSKHNVTCEVEVIKADYLNEAYERMLKSDVHYRFVIDIQGSLTHDYSK